MVTRAQVLDALKTVQDPELHKDLVELNMIEEIEISGGHVTVTVKLTIAGCPLKGTIENDVTEAVTKVDGVNQVTVNLSTMNDEERRNLVSQLHGDQQAPSPLLQGNSKTEVIAVASGKGGVGKSTVAVNLAVALAERGHAVGLMDCDIYGFSIPGMMSIEQRPTVIDEMILPIDAFGVRVISMEFFLQENRPVIWRGPMLGKMLQTFFDRVYWGELDYMILDLPPGTGDVALDVHRLLPGSRELIVTTPHPTATHVAYRAAKMAIDTDHQIIGVVENMSYFRPEGSSESYQIFGQGGGEALARQLSVTLLAKLPLGNAMRGGTAVFEADTEARQAFDKIADACEQVAAGSRG
ncbi:MAG: Mrp/NBP35 family ATP-binding protein [Thermaerobacterales bacterium]